MTESHIRVNISANWVALQNLDATSYKILMCLSGRANPQGTCYPSCERIAFDCNLHIQTVYKGLKTLLTYNYIRVLRKTFYDAISGQKMPTVWQVSPKFLELADEFVGRANTLWNNLDINASESISYINQQQNQHSEQIPLTNSSNQQQQKTTDSENEPRTANSEPQKQQPRSKQPGAAQQSSLPPQNPALVKFYTNPKFCEIRLEDDRHEMLAERMVDNGFKLKLARGFILEYGFAKCFAAAEYTDYCVAYQDIDSWAGFYRSIIQKDLVAAQIEKRYGRAAERDYDEYLES